MRRSGIANTTNSLAESRMLIRFFTWFFLFLFIPYLTKQPLKKDFTRNLSEVYFDTQCRFYAIPAIPEVHNFFLIYYPWPYDNKSNWGLKYEM